jgi:hypothetical protein
MDGNAEEAVIQKTTANQPPKRSDFNIPETEKEFKEMIEFMTRCGIKPNEAEAIMKTRKPHSIKQLENLTETIHLRVNEKLHEKVIDIKAKTKVRLINIYRCFNPQEGISAKAKFLIQLDLISKAVVQTRSLNRAVVA